MAGIFLYVFRFLTETLFEMFHYLLLLFRNERNQFIYLSWWFLTIGTYSKNQLANKISNWWSACCDGPKAQTEHKQNQSVSSVAQSCPTLCDPINRSTPGLPVHHKLPEFAQTHAHQVGDVTQPSHPLSSPSPPASNPRELNWNGAGHP